MDKPVENLSEIEAFLSRHRDVVIIEMLLADMNGILRGKQIARDYASKLYTTGIRMPGSNYLLDWTGQNIPTLKFGTADGDPDYFCFAVPGALRPVPWAERPTAQVLASMYHEDGAPYFADPRYILKRTLTPLAELGLKPTVAIEYEFYLIDQQSAASGTIEPAASPAGRRRPSETNVYGMDDLQDFETFLSKVHEACAIQGLPAETFVSEYAPGQFEINLHHVDDALLACDQAILLERCIKQVARRQGFIASFMAKPFAETAGSGLHVHVSLFDSKGRNVLAGPVDPVLGRPLSSIMHHAIGGLIDTMTEAMAIFAPNANSYRRLKPGTYAPVKANWGGDNRTVSIRIPGSDEDATRIEHRVAGADANPYLVVAAVLAGIHHGITHKRKPPPPVIGDGYAQEATVLPTRWQGALDAFSQGTVLRHYLGADYWQAFLTARQFECDNFHYQIQPLDYQWYLRTA